MASDFTDIPQHIRRQIPAYQAFCKQMIGDQTSSTAEYLSDAVSVAIKKVCLANQKQQFKLLAEFEADASTLMTIAYQFAVTKLVKRHLNKINKTDLAECADVMVNKAQERFSAGLTAVLGQQDKTAGDFAQNMAGQMILKMTQEFEQALNNALDIPSARAIA